MIYLVVEGPFTVNITDISTNDVKNIGSKAANLSFLMANDFSVQKFQPDGILPISSELELIDNLGDRHKLKANIGPIIPVNFQDDDGNQSILVQAFGTFELDGVSGGYGTFETLRKVVKQ